jgi:two-component system, NarL family, sensor kinase
VGGGLALALETAGERRGWRTRRSPDGFAVSVIGSIAALLVLEAAAVMMIDRLAERSALSHAGAVASEAANVALAPFLTDEMLAGDPAAVDAIGRAGSSLVDSDDIVHLKIWNADGEVLWADDPALIGRRFEFDAEERALLGTRSWLADVSTLDEPENVRDAPEGSDRLLEVYFGALTADGQPVLVEIYGAETLLTERASELRSSFLPLMTIGLIVLALGQIALVWTLGRRLARAERRQARLLRRLIDASDAERLRIAGEVHDGVVQSLAGISFQLAAAPDAKTVRRLAEMTQGAVGELRGLLTSIYPVTVPRDGWVAGLDDLVDGLRQLGVEVVVDVAPVRLSEMEELLLLRVTREALRNVAAHAQASRVDVRLVGHGEAVTLTVTDDGRGFDPTAEVPDHFGLRLVRDLIDDAGGTLETDSAPGCGTTLICELAVAQ